jgi:hypothetical protein
MQIKTFLIPETLWMNGYHYLPHLPPLNIPASDALAIERRAHKKVNYFNEKHRYTLCCERIQSIVLELSYESGVLKLPFVFSSDNTEEDNKPSAMAHFEMMNLLNRWMFRNIPEQERIMLYARTSFVFFPPQDIDKQIEIFELLNKHNNIYKLFRKAAKKSNTSKKTCQNTFQIRHKIFKVAAENNSGVVDVLEFL